MFARTEGGQATARGHAAIRHGGGAALLFMWQKGQGWWEMANACQVVLYEVVWAMCCPVKTAAAEWINLSDSDAHQNSAS